MIGVLIPCWGRPELTQRALAYWADLSPSRLRPLCILSPDDPNPPAPPAGVEVVWHENGQGDMRPKWQAGLDALRGRIGALVVMGSDNFATMGYVEAAVAACEARGAACSSSLVYAHPETDRAFEARYRTVYAGAAYSADLLDRIDWNLFMAKGTEGQTPDHSTIVQVAKAGASYAKVPPLIETGEMLVDIKGPGNVWSYEQVLHKAAKRRTILREIPAQTILDTFHVS